MRIVRPVAAALCLAAATAACSGSADTGSAGGWRVTGVGLRSAVQECTTPAPALDTFSATPTPNPACSPAAKNAFAATAEPSPSDAPANWKAVHVQAQYHNAAGEPQWHTIYSTYTSPPGAGVYQPMVSATNQPMPTPPFSTPTPKVQTPPPLPTAAAGSWAAPSSTP